MEQDVWIQHRIWKWVLVDTFVFSFCRGCGLRLEFCLVMGLYWGGDGFLVLFTGAGRRT